MAPNHFLIRIGDGKHFRASSDRSIWGVRNKTAMKGVLAKVKKGDILWFVLGKTGGKVLAVATYERQNPRVLGPLLALTATNEELGWTSTDGDWDTEIHYSGLKFIDSKNVLTRIRGGAAAREYKGPTTTSINLPTTYVTL